MVSRRALKGVHEDAVLRQFKAHLEKRGARLEILNRPDPPDATVELNGQRTWIEITDAFLNKAHAINLTTGASDDTERIPNHNRYIANTDEIFSTALRSAIRAKHDKLSMQKIAKTLGPGILLVGIFTPFTTAEAVAHDEAASVAELISGRPIHIFNTVYAYEGTGQRSFHVLYQREA